VAPALPAGLGRVALRGVRIAGARVDLTGEVSSGKIDQCSQVTGLPGSIKVVQEPPRPG
jgi:hypothetical protein